MEKREYYIDEKSGLKCFDEGGLTYVEEPQSGLFYPGIVAADSDPMPSLGKWGSLRMNYVKDHKPALWTELVVGLEVNQHCYDVEQEALELHEQLLNERMKPYRHLQAENYAEYLKTLNNITNQVDEIVSSQLIYV